MGIKIGARDDGRPKPFFVRYGHPRKTESFASEKDRNERAKELQGTITESGREAMRFDPKEWKEFKAWKAGKQKLRDGILVGPAVTAYLESRAKEGLAYDSMVHLTTNLNRFAEFCVGMMLADVTPEVIENWLKDLVEKFEVGPATLRHHRKDLNVFLGRAVTRHKWISENPCASVPVPVVEVVDEISTMELRDVFAFFKANRNTRGIGRLACEAFGGFRHSSAGRIKAPDLDRENEGITFRATQHKTGRRYYVDGYPRNLWLWINHAPKQDWEVTERTHAEDKKHAFIRADLKNPGNVFRHTFATMHLAAFKNPAATATLLTHRNLTMMFHHYRGRGVPQQTALAFFKITPKTVQVSFERFCRLCGIQPPTK